MGIWICITGNNKRNERKVIACDDANVHIRGKTDKLIRKRKSVRLSHYRRLGSYSMNANRFGKLVTPSTAQVIGRNRVITSGRSRIARCIPVGRTYIRVMKL